MRLQKLTGPLSGRGACLALAAGLVWFVALPLPAAHGHAQDGNAELTGIIANHVDTFAHQGAAARYPQLTNSLWGNMVLTMAYARDEELNRIMKKQARVGKWAGRSAVAMSGIGLASSVVSLATLGSSDHGSHVEGDEHSNHGSGPRDNPTAAILGVTGSGLSLATLGTSQMMRRHYGKRLDQRQAEIQEAVWEGMTHYTTPQGQAKLTELIGPQATGEITQLLTVLKVSFDTSSEAATTSPSAPDNPAQAPSLD
ncbi:MAG: hypothetical protein KC474_03480 [Cyanobacteria bacterium HKST-UBA04]|nr:hypothetical protein [Cyanobacteria bacterium HKST-UBA04]MCA9841562.1 hypothetical protein [Cyanobacteria bacterium HKST-UBA03]